MSSAFVKMELGAQVRIVDSHLLQLLRKELWQTDVDFELQWSQVKAVLSMAEEQAVSGQVLHALLNSSILKEHETEYYDALGMLVEIQQQNELLNRQLIRFHRLMIDVPHVVVKGQMVAQYYPDASLRQSGDVDFYCTPTHYQKAKGLISAIPGIEWIESDSPRHERFLWNEVLFEMHSSLMTFYVGKHQRYWEREVEPYVSNPTEEALYVFVHLFHHLIVGGIGLRQFCDLAMTIHHHYQYLDAERLHRHLKGLGLSNAFYAVGWVLVNAIGLPKNKFPFKMVPKDEKRGAKILENVLKTGNFGTNIRKQGKTGIWLSLETGGIVMTQIVRHYHIAPLELTYMLPKMIFWNVRKYYLKRHLS